jgi:preprotein translocase subunit SecB
MRGIIVKKKEHNLSVISQCVKDLSFENLSSFSETGSPDVQPQIDVQVKVDVSKGDEPNMFSVSLIAEVNAKLNKPLFILELTYTGEFLVEGFPDDLINLVLYVECPRLLFPFVRCIIANVATDGGFPPLYLAPINFMEMYIRQVEALKASASKNE